MSIIPKRTVSQLSRVHQGLMMALCRLSLFHRSGNAASATPYFGHRVQRAPKANSSTAAGSARPASGHCLQRLPHQAINTYNNAYVKPIRFGSSSSSSPPGNFFVIYKQCFHCPPSPRLISTNAHARRPRSSVDCYCQTLAVPPRSPCPGGAVALQLWAIGCMWWAHQPVRKLYRMLIGNYRVSVSCCHPGFCRWRHLDLPALAELLLCSCGP